MTDENDNGRQSSPTGARAPLTLKPRTGGAVSSGMVKQSFSHGRSKTVVVETKRRRVDAPGAGPAAPLSAERRAAFDVRGPRRPAPAAPPATARRRRHSEDERRARQRVIELARQQQERQAAEREARTRVEPAGPAPDGEAAEPAQTVDRAPPVEAAPSAAPTPSTTAEAGIAPRLPVRRSEPRPGGASRVGPQSARAGPRAARRPDPHL